MEGRGIREDIGECVLEHSAYRIKAPAAGIFNGNHRSIGLTLRPGVRARKIQGKVAAPVHGYRSRSWIDSEAGVCACRAGERTGGDIGNGELHKVGTVVKRYLVASLPGGNAGIGDARFGSRRRFQTGIDSHRFLFGKGFRGGLSGLLCLLAGGKKNRGEGKNRKNLFHILSSFL